MLHYEMVNGALGVVLLALCLRSQFSQISFHSCGRCVCVLLKVGWFLSSSEHSKVYPDSM